MPISWYLVFKDIQLMQVTLTKISRSECESTVMGQGTTSLSMFWDHLYWVYSGSKSQGARVVLNFFLQSAFDNKLQDGWIFHMAEEHLKYVFKGSLHYLCWLGVILGREQQILLSQQRLDVVNFVKNMKKKILHADIMWKMASWKLLSVDPNRNLYIFYR